MLINLRTCFRLTLVVILWASLSGAVLPTVRAGSSPSSQQQPAAQEGSVISFAAGATHTCAVVQTPGGNLVRCWGDNTYGELGTGNNTSSDVPVTATGLPSNVIQVSAATYNTCALTANSKVYCWGLLRWGGVNQSTPQLMSGMPSGVVEIALADLHMCLRTSGGAAMCAGNNLSGELGNNSTSYSAVPVNVTNLGSGVISIKTGSLHTCALTSGGAVLCWGRGNEGQLGDNAYTTSSVPVGVLGLSNGIKAIAAGGWHSCALTTAGKVKCWGSNDDYELGGDSTDIYVGAPIDVRMLTATATAISAGERHTCALTAAGAVRCWGYNFGPIEGVTGLTGGVTAIASGAFHMCALAPISSGDISLRCAGSNASGQLGDGTQTDSFASVEVQGLIPRTKSYIAGHILLSDGRPLAGVTVSAGAGLMAQTQPDGSFLFSGLPAGAYTLTPSKSGCTFLPTTLPVTVPPDGGGQVFTATCTPTLLPSATAVALGNQFTCALTTGGEVMCWGRNDSAQLGNGTSSLWPNPTPVSGLASGVTGLASGSGHTCAITSTSVMCWGANGDFELGDGTNDDHTLPVPVSGLGSGVTKLALGDSYSCALITGGSVKCWGRNSEQELGDGSSVLSNFRVDPGGVASLSGVKAIAAGGWHTCALLSNGGVKCWGFNGSGELGDGTTNNNSTPVDVVGFSGASGQPKVIGLAADSNSTCVLTQDHTVTCWGRGYGTGFGGNNVSGLADSPVTAIAGKKGTYCAQTQSGSVRCWYSWTGSNSPHLASTVPGLEQKVTGFDVGFDHVCALTSDPGLKCWGDNSRGQVGNGTIIGLTPTSVAGLSAVTGISASDHTCVVANSGLQCWGRDDIFHYGFLGTGRAENELQPTPVSGMQSQVAAVASGFDHTCALSSAGGVLCWGANAKGQVGSGSDEWNFTGPVFVQGLRSGVTAIAAGESHTCALLFTGGVKCWGAGDEGQLGSGGTSNSTVPVDVTGLTGAPGEPVIKAIAAGAYHTCAVTEAGAVWCWGANAKGQLGNATNNDSLTPVQVSGLSGATGEPAVTGLALGGNHSCAITASGMQCWGAGDSGQLGNGGTGDKNTPATVSGLGAGILSASAGDGHTCALMTGGALKCWGANGSGQLGNGTVHGALIPQAVSGLSSGVTSVAAGYNHTCAVVSGGLQCWGDNSMAQLGNGGTYLVSPAVDVIPQPVPTTYTLGGVVTDKNSQPVEGVTVSVTGAQAQTIADGSYNLGGLVSGTYTLTPKKSECTFIPASRTVSVPPSANGLKFTADCLAPLDGIAQVRTGYGNTCAISQVGGVYCWGMNEYGQLGDGDFHNSLVAKAVKGLTGNVKDLTLAEEFTCALSTTGAVSCWGKVPGVATFQTTPYPISSWSNGIQAISAGRYHVCALTTAGAVQCMGVSLSGQLGDGKNSDSDVPVDVTGLSSGVTAITAGQEHTCALTSAGAVNCWGYNGAGQLGNGGKTDQYTPVTVNGFTGLPGAVKVKAISAGGYSTCALTVSGEAWCWGDGWYGELGDGTYSDEAQPVEVSGLQIDIASIRVGGGYACEQMTGGEVRCWGGLQGMLESSPLAYARNAPWPVEGLANITYISVGGGWISLHNQPWGYACAVTQDGKVQCWGSNGILGIKDAGMLGNNDTADSAEPVYVTKGPAVGKEHIYLPFMAK